MGHGSTHSGSIDELRAALGERALSTLGVDRQAYSRDLSIQSVLRARAGATFVQPAAVVWPETPEQLAELVRLARKQGRGLLAFGAGSGVVGGLAVDARSVIVDLKAFDDIHLDEQRGLCRVGAGVIGEQLERWLNARGYSLGHFPSSIYCSTVGGWIAARSAGQLSSRYGKIEDLLDGIEAVDGSGRIWRLDRLSDDVDALRLVVGSEGALMIITRARLRVHRLPSHRLLRGADFDSVEQACEAMCALMRAGLQPAVLRVYDPLDTRLSGHAGGELKDLGSAVEVGAIGQAGQEKVASVQLPDLPDPAKEGAARLVHDLLASFGVQQALGATARAALRRLAASGGAALPRLAGLIGDRSRRCRMIYGFEGHDTDLRSTEREALQIIRRCGGRDQGADPGRHWLERRYGVSYKMSRVLDAGLWVDTFEVASRWSQLLSVYRAVRQAVGRHAICLAHFSHAYHDGCSIYFTFVGAGDGLDAALAHHRRTWDAGLWAARRAGAALSHHHGIGRLKAQVLRGSEGAGSTLLRRKLKRVLDPDTVLNPGVLDLGEGDLSSDLAPLAGVEAEVRARGFQRVGELDLDRDSGLVRVQPEVSLAWLCRELLSQGFELGVRAASVGDKTVAQALRDSDPRLAVRLTSVEASVAEHTLLTPLAPRSATGPDSRGFVLGGGLDSCLPRRGWLEIRSLQSPLLYSFHSTRIAPLLSAATLLSELGAAIVELQLARECSILYVVTPGSGEGASTWRQRVERLCSQFESDETHDASDWMRLIEDGPRQSLTNSAHELVAIHQQLQQARDIDEAWPLAQIINGHLLYLSWLSSPALDTALQGWRPRPSGLASLIASGGLS